jgi:hypothetical protein
MCQVFYVAVLYGCKIRYSGILSVKHAIQSYKINGQKSTAGGVGEEKEQVG